MNPPKLAKKMYLFASASDRYEVGIFLHFGLCFSTHGQCRLCFFRSNGNPYSAGASPMFIQKIERNIHYSHIYIFTLMHCNKMLSLLIMLKVMI